MNKFKSFLLSLCPILLAIFLQFLLEIPALGIVIMITLSKHTYYESFDDIVLSLTDVLSSGNFAIIISVVSSTAALLIMLFWYHHSFVKHSSLSTNSNKNTKPGNLLLSLSIMGLSLQILISYFSNLVAYLRPDWFKNYEDLMNLIEIDSASPILILYAVIIAPISEEFIFRGVTLGYAKKAMPALPAILLQAALFGIYHMNIFQGLYAFLMGIVLGYIVYKTGRLLYGILLHGFFNLFGTITPHIKLLNPNTTIEYILLFLVGTVLFLISYSLLFKKEKNAIA